MTRSSALVRLSSVVATVSERAETMERGWKATLFGLVVLVVATLVP